MLSSDINGDDINGDDDLSPNFVAVAAARDALREVACEAVAAREIAEEKLAAVRADVMTLRARLAEANGRCVERGE